MTTESLLARLSKDIGKLLEFNDECNVVIKVGVTPSHHEFKAHSLILRARSSYFYTALSSDWARSQGNVIRFEKPNMSPNIFEAILRYMYNGILKLEDQDLSDILDLLCAADELMIGELMDYIQNYLIQNRSTLIDENLIEVLNIAASRIALSTLKNYCLEEITLLNPSIFESKSFLNLDENALVALLERDDLGMDESKIWDSVLKWGIINTPCLNCSLEDKIGSSNDSLTSLNYEWTSEDFDALEKTLKNCIPLIRFCHIPAIEFHKIKPYSKIIPKELLEKMIDYHLVGNSPNYNNIQPPRICNIQIDSELLNSKQAAIIASWLDRNHRSYSPKSNPYTFKLLFRASVDGPDLFHKKCDNVGPTVIIIKVRDNVDNVLVGGYNPLNISWKRPWFSPARGTKGGFIFSMDSSVKTILDKNAKLARVAPEYKEYAIYDHPWDGPCFGTGPDLWVNINPKNPIGYTTKKCYQPSITNSEMFYWEDWEVFSVQSNDNYIDNTDVYSMDTISLYD
ncbi:hypothetical protein C1645_823003 [Glomus cerebriforme]|uniref:BTB/POZ domain-containing protein n=1 Tax=Glomus cerebriforme TaxID=658196 RepID=A0A397T3L1_9GLOM|nr:hypothetical protein C1645_823003 [Glomus cerebriforme]